MYMVEGGEDHTSEEGEPEERTSERLPLDVSSWKSHSNSLNKFLPAGNYILNRNLHKYCEYN